MVEIEIGRLDWLGAEDLDTRLSSGESELDGSVGKEGPRGALLLEVALSIVRDVLALPQIVVAVAVRSLNARRMIFFDGLVDLNDFNSAGWTERRQRRGEG